MAEPGPEDLTTLLTTLNTRIDEDERKARNIHDMDCHRVAPVVTWGSPSMGMGPCNCGVPARMLREVTAKRAMITLALEDASETDHERGDGHDPAEIAAGKCQDHGLTAALRNLAPVAGIWEEP